MHICMHTQAWLTTLTYLVYSLWEVDTLNLYIPVGGGYLWLTYLVYTSYTPCGGRLLVNSGLTYPVYITSGRLVASSFAYLVNLVVAMFNIKLDLPGSHAWIGWSKVGQPSWSPHAATDLPWSPHAATELPYLWLALRMKDTIARQKRYIITDI